MKILHVLLILGLVAANVGNGRRKGRISNCSRFKNRSSIKNGRLIEITGTTKPRL